MHKQLIYLNTKSPTKALLLLFTCLIWSAEVFSAELAPSQHESRYNFSLPDLKEKTHALSDYQGKVVLVNFWASWCTPCLLEMPGMQRLENTLSDKDFVILTLNTTDSVRRIQETLKRLKLSFTVLLDHDGKTFDQWQARVLPTSYLLDKNGRVHYRVDGPMEWDDEYVLLKINQLIQSQ